jgi:hypothetical protein
LSNYYGTYGKDGKKERRKEGNDMLAQASRQVYKPDHLVMFSEGLCTAVHLSGMDFINKSAIFSLNLGSSTWWFQ